MVRSCLPDPTHFGELMLAGHIFIEGWGAEVNQSHCKCILLVMMSICTALWSMTISIWKFIHFYAPPNNKSSNKGSTAGYSLSTSLYRHSFPLLSHLNSSTWKQISLTILFSFNEVDFFSLFQYGFSDSGI